LGSLFLIMGVILFFIVRKNRRKQHAKEAEKHGQIDDGVELDFTAPSAKPGNQQHYPPPDFGDELGPPPKY